MTARAGRPWPGNARTWLLWLHLGVGVTAGVMIALTAATGSLLVFGDEIDRALNRELLVVEPGAAPVPLETVVSRVRAHYPDRRIDRVHLADQPDASLEVCFAEGAEPSCVYANPYTATLLGIRVPLHSFKGRLFSFHRRLFSGRSGERVVGVLGILLVALAVTGLILWTHARRPVRPWRSPASATPYVRRHNWHRAVGLWSMPLLILLGATGTAMIFRPTFEGTLNRLAGTRALEPPSVPASASDARASVDAALDRVKDALPGATPTYVIFPASAAAPLAVRARMPGEWLPKGRTFVYVSPHSGEVLRADNALASPLGYRIGNGLYPLHVGIVGGLPTRLLQCAAGIAPPVLCWTGLLMWWRRVFPKRRAAARWAA